MVQDKKLVTVDELLAGTAHFDEAIYVKTKNGGYQLRADLLEEVNAAAQHRWENGGKEIYEKLQTIPDFDQTDEYKEYMRKFNLPL